MNLTAYVLAVWVVFITQTAKASPKEVYWVSFSDKGQSSFDPYQFFDAKSIERRIAINYPLDAYEDRPVDPSYINAVQKRVISTHYPSRWLNGIAVYATPDQITALKTLPFIKAVELFRSKAELEVACHKFSRQKPPTTTEGLTADLLLKQTKRLGGHLFWNKNIDGTGVRIAVFDAGYINVHKAPEFKHLFEQRQIKRTWDFVGNDANVYAHGTHGTMVLSCIAGMDLNTRIGLATGAEFLLARTERNVWEPFSEELHWLAAAEWADKHGADIINSSLGYTRDRYFPDQMDGKTSFVVRAANAAAKRGILVVNAAGNEGNDKHWRFVGTPADGDSVLAVGGIEMSTDLKISFSSEGPTFDGRMKPNVCAFGHVAVRGKNGMERSYGTSFAAPLVTGFAACVRQLKPNLRGMALFREIEKSGHLYPYFDYAHGYGVPQATYFLQPKTLIEPTFSIFQDDSLSLIKIRIIEDDNQQKTIPHTYLDNKFGEFIKPDPIYYAIVRPNGIIRMYSALNKFFVDEKQELKIIDINQIFEGEKIIIHYKGYVQTFNP